MAEPLVVTTREELIFLLCEASELEHLLKLDLYDNSSRLRLAVLYAANGRDKGAARLFEAARQLSPDEPEVHEREGRALLQQCFK